ncbi:MAG: NAD/NADP octopine/nopaline dehydrogenase family protein [Bacteroidales bacterium]|nr:NAD/NADP octopine/nopaline dehydrogenase family protein [Bacteroidales bacterium]
MKKLNITIIGAGNAGCAHAFKLSEKGHIVNLVKTSSAIHNENFKAIEKSQGIWALDHVNNDLKSFQRIRLITRDMKAGLRNADVILIMTQSLQHEIIAESIAPHIGRSVKMIIVIPGNLGSILFNNVLQNNNIIYAEGESTPFDARIIEPGLVNILFKNVRNSLGFYPSSTSKEGLSIAQLLLDSYVDYRSNVIESALHNPNLIVHTIGVIMSASRIEYSRGNFWMYREAFTKSIWNLVNDLDNEKNKVIASYGGKPSSYLDECKYRNEKDISKDSLQVFMSYAKDGGPKGPKSINSRYLFEDVPNGLCLLSSLGDKANIETPIADSLINIASSLVKSDFKKTGRTVEKLGWSQMTIDDIINNI